MITISTHALQEKTLNAFVLQKTDLVNIHFSQTSIRRTKNHATEPLVYQLANHEFHVNDTSERHNRHWFAFPELKHPHHRESPIQPRINTKFPNPNYAIPLSAFHGSLSHPAIKEPMAIELLKCPALQFNNSTSSSKQTNERTPVDPHSAAISHWY